MAWLRIDDRVRTHPKLVSAGPAAAWFWFCGVCYCREHLTDGVIPRGMVPTLAPGVTSGKKLAAKLVECGLWHVHADGYEVHDFLDWNPSRESVEAQRAADRARKTKGFQTESEPTPKGIQTTPSCASAGVAGYGSGKSSGSGSSEKASSGDVPPARPVPLSTRRRLELANEHDPVPLRWDQFREIQSLAAPRFGSVDAAYGPVLEWVHQVGDQLKQRGTPKGAITNPWQFWRERAEAEWCVDAGPALTDAERIAARIRADYAAEGKAL